MFASRSNRFNPYALRTNLQDGGTATIIEGTPIGVPTTALLRRDLGIVAPVSAPAETQIITVPDTAPLRRNLGIVTNSVASGDKGFNLGVKISNSRSYTFSGSHSGLVLPISNVVPTSLTFGVWIRPARLSVLQNILSKSSYFATSPGDFPISFFLNGNTLAIWLDRGNDFSLDLAFGSSGISFSVNSWRHVGFSYSSGGQARLYVDGEVNASASMSFTPSNNVGRDWTLGRTSFFNSGDSDFLYLGDMRDPFISLGEQSDALIASLAADPP
jgi:hypothetical protein